MDSMEGDDGKLRESATGFLGSFEPPFPSEKQPKNTLPPFVSKCF